MPSTSISVGSAEGQSLGIVFYGLAGPKAVPYGAGSGTLCVGNPIQRTGVHPTGGQAGACDGSVAVDWNQFVATHPLALGVPMRAGTTVWAQAWCRDPAGGGGAVLSDGLWFTVCP